MLLRNLLMITLVGVAAAAARAEPLVDALPEDALVLVYSPSLSKLIDAINEFTPGPQADIPMSGATLAAQVGLPVDAFDGPMAIVMLAPVEKGADPAGAFILELSPEALRGLTQGMKPDADGIYELPNGGDPFSLMMLYRGNAAFSDDRKYLKALAATPQEAWKPTRDAAQLLKNAQAFVHVNLPLIIETFDEEIADGLAEVKTELEDELRQQNSPFGPGFAEVWIGWCEGVVELGKEVQSIDVAARYGASGMDIQAAITIAPGGTLARYMVTSGGLNALQPALPAVDQFMCGGWIRLDKTLMDTLIADYTKLGMSVMQEMQKDEAKQAELKDAVAALLKDAEGTFGERIAVALGMPGGVLKMVQAFEVREPDEFRATLKRMVESYNTVAKAIPTGDDSEISVRYVYTPNAETIAGEKVDRVKMLMETDNEEANAQLDQMFSLYGPDGLNYYVAVVRNMAAVATNTQDMADLILALKGDSSVELLRDDPSVKSMARKVGLNNDAIFMVVPARFLEAGMQIAERAMGRQNNAMPLPFATPAVMGVRVADPATLRIDVHVPQSVVTECMTVVMTTMMGAAMAP